MLRMRTLLQKTFRFTVSSIIITFTLQPLKRFDRPLMRVSLSDSILVTLIFY